MEDMWSQFDFDRTIRDFDFTRRAMNDMHKVVYSADFEDMDAETIFAYLNGNMEVVRFNEQLKRYLYHGARIREPFHEVPDQVYLDIIKSSFEETRTPYSFEPTTRRPAATMKSWLVSDSVRRPTIFLLGFGLRMTAQEVSEFLTKVNKEEDFNLKDPTEVVYRYCYRGGFPYARARQLLEWYDRAEESGETDGRDAQIRQELLALKKELAEQGTQYQAMKTFRDVLNRAKKAVAKIYTEDEENEKGREWTAEEITSADLEKIICCGIPRTGSGNLEKMTASQLSSLFDKKRLSRQRLDRLQDGTLKLDRFDLITLLFFVYSQEQEGEEPEKRCKNFIDEMNEVLAACSMSGLYAVNPYEAAILMCLLSESPLETYTEIWELSYEK